MPPETIIRRALATPPGPQARPPKPKTSNPLRRSSAPAPPLELQPATPAATVETAIAALNLAMGRIASHIAESDDPDLISKLMVRIARALRDAAPYAGSHRVLR